jgi:hypothetical protein
MNKERLEWIVSGLNQYALTEAEEQFLKTVLEDFDKNQVLTGKQEEKLETLYEQKSKMTPNRNRFAVKEANKRTNHGDPANKISYGYVKVRV